MANNDHLNREEIMAMTEGRTNFQMFDKDTVKTVTKPWGWERWLTDGSPIFRYSIKEIFIKAPNQSSIQVHESKQETTYIQGGSGVLFHSVEPLDVDRYLDGGYTDMEINSIIDNLEQKQLSAGAMFHIFPGTIHRLLAVEDLLLIEASSTELDDVIRLRDDTGRGHGHIALEHQ